MGSGQHGAVARIAAFFGLTPLGLLAAIPLAVAAYWLLAPLDWRSDFQHALGAAFAARAVIGIGQGAAWLIHRGSAGAVPLWPRSRE